jgi:ribulose-phosphate 3-epimerase
MTTVSASILSADFLKLKDEVLALQNASVDKIHIDVMDGVFVPNLTIGPMVIKAMRKISPLFFDVHLMIKDPEKSLNDYIEAGADSITVHAESVLHLDRIINFIKSYDVKVGVALNPATHEDMLKYVLKELDLVLVMSVNPGFCGQTFLESSLNKIAAIKNMIKQCQNHNCLISVDGGINEQTGALAIKAGADCLVSGSYIFNFEDYSIPIKLLKSLS